MVDILYGKIIDDISIIVKMKRGKKGI